MKKIVYYLLPPTGNHISEKIGSLKDLLLDIPYLINRHKGNIPPLHVINEILLAGVQDAGMSGGCRWEPFQIDENEFNELINEIKSENENIGFIEPAAWVVTHDDWRAWEMERLHGIPAQEYRNLWNEIEKVDEEIRNAERKGDKELVEKSVLKHKEADRKMTNLIMKYVKYNKT